MLSTLFAYLFVFFFPQGIFISSSGDQPQATAGNGMDTLLFYSFHFQLVRAVYWSEQFQFWCLLPQLVQAKMRIEQALAPLHVDLFT